MKNIAPAKSPARPVALPSGRPLPLSTSARKTAFSDSLAGALGAKGKPATADPALSTAGRGQSALQQRREETSEREKSFSERGIRRNDKRDDERNLAAFSPTLGVLVPPAAPVISPNGPRAMPADLSRFAEQVVTHVRLGRVGEGPEIRLGLRLGSEGLEVRLRREGDRISASIVGDPRDCERLADTVRASFEERGIDAEIEVIEG